MWQASLLEATLDLLQRGVLMRIAAGLLAEAATSSANRSSSSYPFHSMCSVPAPTPGSDDALLEANRRLRVLLEDFWNDQSDPPEAAYSDKVSALPDFIAKTPAIGVAGVRVKFEEVLGLDSLDGVAIGPDLVETITEALDRLAKAPALD